MSALTKKRLTEDEIEITIHDRSERRFRLPKEKARGLLRLIGDYEVEDDHQLLPANEVFKDLHKKYGKAGSILRGLRGREELTQDELAEKIGIPQTDISQIENGKRPIGKKMAKRLATVFKTDYRVFL
jgi:DNA-binding XRE family transcriptional regulator